MLERQVMLFDRQLKTAKVASGYLSVCLNPMSNDKPARSKPYPVLVEAGNIYYWCSCGKSKMLPFCDAAHVGTNFVPVPYKAEKTGTVYFCGCRKTKNVPLCDGSHERCEHMRTDKSE